MSEGGLSRWAAAGLAAALVVGAWACGGSGGDAREGSGEDVEAGALGEASGAAEASASSIEPLATTEVDVYFPAALGDGLVVERREIFLTASPVDRAKQILADLLNGPETEAGIEAVPRGVRLRQVYVLDDGTAWVDFSADLARRLGGGTHDELLTLYSIVNSLATNVEEIGRVGILVDGAELETLGGHIDLRRPVAPNFDLRLDVEPAERPPWARDGRGAASA